MLTSSPRTFGRNMGEPVCTYPGTMASTSGSLTSGKELEKYMIKSHNNNRHHW